MKYKEMRDYTMMNLAIDQSNLYLLISSKMGWLSNMLSNDEGISIVDAIKNYIHRKCTKSQKMKVPKLGIQDLLLFMKILWKKIIFFNDNYQRYRNGKNLRILWNIRRISFHEELINEQSYNIINIFENNFVIQILICYFA